MRGSSGVALLASVTGQWEPKSHIAKSVNKEDYKVTSVIETLLECDTVRDMCQNVS